MLFMYFSRNCEIWDPKEWWYFDPLKMPQNWICFKVCPGNSLCKVQNRSNLWHFKGILYMLLCGLFSVKQWRQMCTMVGDWWCIHGFALVWSSNGTEQSLFFCQNPRRETGQDETIAIFFLKMACMCKIERFFFVFLGESDFVPGHPGTRVFVPGVSLSQDTGWVGQGKFFVWGRPECSGTFHWKS